MVYVRHESRMNEPVEGGGTVRSHLEKAAKNKHSKYYNSMNDEPELPLELRYLWDWFVALNGGKSSEGISWVDVEAWSRLTKNEPEPHEVGAILAIDHAWRNPGKA